MTQRRSTCLLLVVILLSGPSTLWGEVFVLDKGGRVEGELLNPGEEPREVYLVKTSDGINLTLRKEQVKQVVQKLDAIRLYETFLPRMPQSAQGNWLMAEYCLKLGLKEQRQIHLEEAIKLDPEHEDARRALGYERIEGRWQQREEFWNARGYVRYKGAWRLKQDVDLEVSKLEREKQEKDWRRQIRVWRGWVLKGRGKEAEGLQNIRAIKDRRAARALAELLDDDEEPKSLKLVYAETLGTLRSPLGTDAFVSRAINDADADVRDKCLDQLVAWDSSHAAAVFIKTLGDKENRFVNRAAVALGRLRDSRATLPLIEALTTKHKKTIQPRGGNIGASFGSNGVNGFTAGGGGPKVIETEFKNSAVLGALSVINPGVNYGYEKEEWKRWYEEISTPNEINLRRDS